MPGQKRFILPGELGRMPQLILPDAGFVPVQGRVVVQLLPWDRVDFGPQA